MKTLRYLLLIGFCFLAGNLNLQAQQDTSAVDKVQLLSHIWTDGFEFARHIPSNVREIIGIPNPSFKEKDLIFFCGGSLHEGGTHFCLEEKDGQFFVTDRGTDAYQWFPVGDRLSFDSKQEHLIFRDGKSGELHGILQILPTFDNLKPMIQEDLRVFALAGNYVDQKGNHYSFSATENRAMGFPFDSPIYTFADVYDVPTTILVFLGQIYQASCTNKWLLLTPMEVGDDGFYPLKGESEIFLKRITEPDEYEYPLVSEKLLTARQFLLYAGSSAISYRTENYESSLLRVIETLATMRNEIYARHGYIFPEQKWKDHFGQRLWYHPEKENVEEELTEIERLNVEHLLYLEKNMKKELESEP